MFRALKHFLPDLRDRHVLVRTENTAVFFYISTTREVCVRAPYIPGHLNMGADILSMQGQRPGEWKPHPEVVKQICRVFSQAQVDLFATHHALSPLVL